MAAYDSYYDEDRYSLYRDQDDKQKDKIKEFAKLTKLDPEDADKILRSCNWDLTKALEIHNSEKKKKKKEKKQFKVGDVIKCVDTKKGKLPEECYEFLLTYKKFKVLDVNDKLNIDLGNRLEDTGNPYYYNPNRFELFTGTASTKSMDYLEEDDIIGDF
jgi:hypothetical protein